jgi:hypothetical protein
LNDAAVEEPETARASMAPGAGVHDEGEFYHSQNDELRMCRLTGDDEEDNVRDDCAELFGRSAADAHPCDQDAVPVDVDAADPDGHGAEGDSEVAGSNQPSTSAVWDDFDKLFKKVPGKKNLVGYAAICKHCKKLYSAYSANGTGHLTRHLKVDVTPLIDNFRTAISFLNSSNQRIAAYKSYCIASSVIPRKFSQEYFQYFH